MGASLNPVAFLTAPLTRLDPRHLEYDECNEHRMLASDNEVRLWVMSDYGKSIRNSANEIVVPRIGNCPIDVVGTEAITSM